MTDIQSLIARAEKSLEGVTPGPWLLGHDRGHDLSQAQHMQIWTWRQSGARDLAWETDSGQQGYGLSLADAAFCTAARDLIPELCEALRKAEASRDLHEQCSKELGLEKIALLAERDALKEQLEKAQADLGYWMGQHTIGIGAMRRVGDERDRLAGENAELTEVLTNSHALALRLSQEAKDLTVENTQLKARAAELEEMVGTADFIEQTVIDAVTAERDSYREALEWYADEKNWMEFWTEVPVRAGPLIRPASATYDKGARARQALGASHDGDA